MFPVVLAGEPVAADTLTEESMIDEAQVWEALGQVMVPEIPFSVVDLGLVYGVEVSQGRNVRVQLTLTTKGCPLVRHIRDDIQATVQRLTGSDQVEVELVWDPPWNREMAAEHVQAYLSGGRRHGGE